MRSLATRDRIEAFIERLGDAADSEGTVYLSRGFVDRALVSRLFDEIEPELYRFPAVDAASFRARVESVVSED